jgi:hypothetical protein
MRRQLLESLSQDDLDDVTRARLIEELRGCFRNCTYDGFSAVPTEVNDNGGNGYIIFFSRTNIDGGTYSKRTADGLARAIRNSLENDKQLRIIAHFNGISFATWK